jgi:hypothetical protein
MEGGKKAIEEGISPSFESLFPHHCCLQSEQLHFQPPALSLTNRVKNKGDDVGGTMPYRFSFFSASVYNKR